MIRAVLMMAFLGSFSASAGQVSKNHDGVLEIRPSEWVEEASPFFFKIQEEGVTTRLELWRTGENEERLAHEVGATPDYFSDRELIRFSLFWDQVKRELTEEKASFISKWVDQIQKLVFPRANASPVSLLGAAGISVFLIFSGVVYSYILMMYDERSFWGEYMRWRDRFGMIGNWAFALGLVGAGGYGLCAVVLGG